MTNVTDEVLKIIETKSLSPRSRLWFAIRRAFIWLGVFSMVAIGSIGASSILYISLEAEWDIAKLVTNNDIGFVLHILPYFWLAILVIALMVTNREIKQLRRGYKLPLLWAAVIYTIITFIIGGILYVSGLAAKLEESSANVPAYSLISGHRRIWNNPASGLLAGQVQSITDSTLTITDLRGQTWSVVIGSGVQTGPNILKHSLKFVGSQTGTSTFTASEIRPWCGCAHCLRANTKTCAGYCGK